MTGTQDHLCVFPGQSTKSGSNREKKRQLKLRNVLQNNWPAKVKKCGTAPARMLGADPGPGGTKAVDGTAEETGARAAGEVTAPTLHFLFRSPCGGEKGGWRGENSSFLGTVFPSTVSPHFLSNDLRGAGGRRKGDVNNDKANGPTVNITILVFFISLKL